MTMCEETQELKSRSGSWGGQFEELRTLVTEPEMDAPALLVKEPEALVAPSAAVEGARLREVTLALVMELERERAARREAERKLEEQGRFLLMYKLEVREHRRRRRRVRFASTDSGLDDDEEEESEEQGLEDDESESASVCSSEAATETGRVTDEEPSVTYISESVYKTLEVHAHGLQRKNETLYAEICELSERLQRSETARLEAETRGPAVVVQPASPSSNCPVCYEALSSVRSPRSLQCCGAVACRSCLEELVDDDGGLCCPECFKDIDLETLPSHQPDEVDMTRT